MNPRQKRETRTDIVLQGSRRVGCELGFWMFVVRGELGERGAGEIE